MVLYVLFCSSRRRHTRSYGDWSSDVCSSDLVPLAVGGATPVITDDGRIRASVPTIATLAERGARVVVCAHLGRPKGAHYAERAAAGLSLGPVATRRGELLGRRVTFAPDVAGDTA